MSTGSALLLTVLAAVAMCVAVSAASRRPDAAWNYYYFDGRAFVAGRPVGDSPFLAVRDRDVPLVLTRAARAVATPLPSDKGALAGICFLRSSGGKLAGSGGHTPLPGKSVTIYSSDQVVMSVTSDEKGYFVALLPAGVYRIGSGAFTAEATVETGKTTLAAVQAGKRMVD